MGPSQKERDLLQEVEVDTLLVAYDLLPELGEHGDDRFVRYINSTRGYFPAVRDEPYDDHEGEEGIERRRKREVYSGKFENERALDLAVRFQSLVNHRCDAHRCIDGVSPERHRRFSGDSNTNREQQFTRGRGRG